MGLFLVAFCFLGTSAYYIGETGHVFITAAFMQGAAVFLALSLAFFFFEFGAQRRQRRVDRVLDIAIQELRNEAVAAVVSATTAVWNEPESFGLIPEPEEFGASFEASKKLLLDRSYQLRDYPDDVLERGTLFWASRSFQDLAIECDQLIRTLGSSLAEYGVLLGAMRVLEDKVSSEKKVWDEYLIISVNQKDRAIPVEAGYNLAVLAADTLRLIDVLDSGDYGGELSPKTIGEADYDNFHRSRDWGFWSPEYYENKTSAD